MTRWLPTTHITACFSLVYPLFSSPLLSSRLRPSQPPSTVVTALVTPLAQSWPLPTLWLPQLVSAETDLVLAVTSAQCPCRLSSWWESHSRSQSPSPSPWISHTPSQLIRCGDKSTNLYTIILKV